jgi:hypothetical protein
MQYDAKSRYRNQRVQTAGILQSKHVYCCKSEQTVGVSLYKAMKHLVHLYESNQTQGILL